MLYGDKGFVLLNERLVEAVIIRSLVNLTVVLLEDLEPLYHKGDIITISRFNWTSK